MITKQARADAIEECLCRADCCVTGWFDGCTLTGSDDHLVWAAAREAGYADSQFAMWLEAAALLADGWSPR